jgi:hypothetical protein
MTHDSMLFLPYRGYAEAVNTLARHVLQLDPACDWIVCGGDDTDPDPNHTADEIAAQLRDHFTNIHMAYAEYEPSDHAESKPHAWTLFARTLTGEQMRTFGVMQPTGDRFAFSKAQGSAPIDRVAGSPWLGREWCVRANQGKGPLWPEYTHNFVDEELQNVAIKYGVFWQRPDLIHLHHHYQRETDDINSRAVGKPVPVHLKDREDNPAVHWEPFKILFNQRKRAGFPGSEPL